MPDRTSVPGSVDMTGDLSRVSRVRNDAVHNKPVGEALNSAPFRASMLSQGDRKGAYDQEHSSDTRYPRATPIILVTKKGAAEEFRVGLVSRASLESGLRQKEDACRLNMRIARNCFGGSAVYSDRNVALLEAGALVQNATVGIKVLYVHDTWQN